MPLKIAICGLGSAAERAHLPALAALAAAGEVEICGVSDPSSERLERAAQLLPGARRFTTAEAMLARTQPDLMVVATPPSAHLAAVRAGLERGVDVVCEKPLGLSGDEAALLAQLIADNPRRCVVTVHQYEHAHAWRSIARMINGAIRHEEEWRLEIDIERPGTDPLSAGGWRSEPEREGGVLGDHAVHYLALAWRLAPRARITDFERHIRGGREVARVGLAGSGGRIDISASYAANSRHNRIRAVRPARGLTMAWEDGLLIVSHAGDRARRYRVTSLAERDTVNALYSPFYADVVANLGTAAWRRQRNLETTGVANMLAAALDGVRQEVAASFMADLRAMAQTVLLAFADLGIFLGSDRDRLLLKARSLNPRNPEQLAEFLDLCIAADLVTPSEAGALRLAPDQAQRLARSLEGHTPVPDDQATDWAHALRRAAPA